MNWRKVLPPSKTSTLRPMTISVCKGSVRISADLVARFAVERFDLLVGDDGSFAIDLDENGAWKAQKDGQTLGALNFIKALGKPQGAYPVVVEGTKLVHYANGRKPVNPTNSGGLDAPASTGAAPKVTRREADYTPFLKGGEYEIAETAVGLLNIARALALGNKLDDVAQRFGCKMARLAKFGEAFGPCLFEFENAAEAQRPLVFDVWLEWFREAGK